MTAPVSEQGCCSRPFSVTTGETVQDRLCASLAATSESAFSLHSHLLLLVEPGGVVVRQDPARCDQPRRLHFGCCSGTKATQIYRGLCQIGKTFSLDLYRSSEANSY